MGKLRFSLITYLLILFTTVLVSCGGSEETQEENYDELMEVEIDSTASTLVKFNNTLFSVPSPYQATMLIKDLGMDYNKEYLNPINRSVNYTNNFKKALNLGVYGADLGYLNMYEQIPNALQYFSIVKKFAHELGISGAFSQETIDRIEANMGNKDSIMYIVSNTYRKADTYLKNNDRNNIGVLILAGGWVESLHIMSNILMSNDNIQIKSRIAEQKHPLDNLIKILSPFYNESEEFSELLDGLIDLAYEFDGIDIAYTYEEPAVDVANKLTIIKSTSEVKMSIEQLEIISGKILSIRNKIIE